MTAAKIWNLIQDDLKRDHPFETFRTNVNLCVHFFLLVSLRLFLKAKWLPNFLKTIATMKFPDSTQFCRTSVGILFAAIKCLPQNWMPKILQSFSHAFSAQRQTKSGRCSYQFSQLITWPLNFWLCSSLSVKMYDGRRRGSSLLSLKQPILSKLTLQKSKHITYI